MYFSGLPYSFVNNRVLYRAILWAAHAEGELHTWFSDNYNVEVHAYVKNGKYCVVNNTYEPQDTTVYRGDGSSFDLHLDANEIRWYEISVLRFISKHPSAFRKERRRMLCIRAAQRGEPSRYLKSW